MSKLNLRSYQLDIEKLIDQNLTDDAINHCKFILKTFPKHIDTYRLLGKAYLESRQYEQALDIFQRVLAVFPDDFIAHIGLSIIYEEKKDLDPSIWHMERAFEVQPSNQAIQQELKRLYHHRDGVNLNKIKLTRGALIRMYARGELYPQAISEIRTALSEDPSRTDLEILLAKMLSICNQKFESVELCNQIISKLPYSFEACQILYEILPSSFQEEREKYYHYLCSIDPYYACISSSFPSAVMVPDSAIEIDKYEINGTVGDANPTENVEQSQPSDETLTSNEIPGASTEWVPEENLNPVQANVKNDNISKDDSHFSLSDYDIPHSNNLDNEKAKDNPSEIPEWLKNYSFSDNSGAASQKENNNPGSSLESKLSEVYSPFSPESQTIIDLEGLSFSINQVKEIIEYIHQHIQSDDELGKMISFIKGLLDKNLQSAHLWQALGDAYKKDNQPQLSMNAYAKAEEIKNN